jgi:hypothetical protein
MPRRDDTFIIYYAEDFQAYETDNPSNLYCLSESSIDIILSALRFATWPTRWRLDRQDYRGKVSVSEWEGLRKWGELAIQEVTYEMGCDINDGLTNIANALSAAATSNAQAMAKLSNSVVVLANAQCCEIPVGADAGVQGSVDTGDTGPIPIYGTVPITEGREPGTFPPEFETEGDYLENRCAIANLIVDGVMNTLHGLSTLSVFNATAAAALIGLVAAGILVLPVVVIPILVGCILALAGFVTYFEGMRNEIANRREEYVCILYQGETIEVMIALLADFIDAVLAIVGGAGWATRILKQVFLLLNNPDTLKQLFDGVAGASYTDADCSGCGVDDCPDVYPQWDGTLNRGAVTETGENTYHVESVYLTGFYHNVTLNCNMIPDTQTVCDGPRAYRITNLTGYTPNQGNTSVYVFTRSGMETPGSPWYVGQDVLLCVSNVHYYDIRSSTAFSFDLEVSEVPCE